MVAFSKLQELIRGRPITYPGQKFGNLLLFAAILAAGVAIVAGAERQWLIVAVIAGVLVFGVLFVIPICGGYMAVVIWLLYGFPGIARPTSGCGVPTIVCSV